MINKEEVEHIAKLARLKLNAKEIKSMEKELSSVLEYFKFLNKLDVSKVQPTSHSVSLKNIIREDKCKKQSEENVEKLLKAMPQRKGRYLKVKSVF